MKVDQHTQLIKKCQQLLLIASVTLLSACGSSDSTVVNNNDSGNTDDSVVVDTTAPMITLNGDAIISHNLGETYSDLGANAIDDIDGEITVNSSGSVDVDTVGSYTITYTATDNAGNTSNATRTVNVVNNDTSAPTITLNGEAIISHNLGETYTDLGANAIDDIDGEITVNSSGSVDIDTVGSYTITYTATDSAGNTATETRIVNIVNNIDDMIDDEDPETELTALDSAEWLLSASNNEDELALAIDSDSSTSWSTEENQQSNQWIEIDLVSSYLLTAITLDNSQTTTQYPSSFELLISSDGINWTTVSNYSGSASSTQLSLDNLQAQYVRISLTTSSDQNPWSIDELTIYAEEDSNPPTAYTYTSEMLALQKIQAHILGTSTLSDDEISAQQTIIEADLTLFTSNIYQVDLAFDVIELYDQTYGALFTNGSKTDGGISSRSDTDYQLEYAILSIMQGIVDYSYSEENLQQYPIFFTDKAFASSDFFPGSVATSVNPDTNYSISVNGTHVRGFGIPANYETEDARRPTGTYLPAGKVATITVPESLVDIGASILVGAHSWDLSSKTSIKRMDRVTTEFAIDSQEVTISNPLGGGIYINIPYEQDLGILDISINNVVQSPYYANTSANQTTLSEWQDEQRSHGAPWADFETDKVMFQVPTSWIYAMEDPSSAMNDWDLSMDAISELFARPLIRPKTVVYAQVDVIMRGSANFPGYPQSNTTYNPDLDYGGSHEHFFLTGPRQKTGYIPSVFFHELGHAENFHKFEGEVEASVNFLYAAVQNKKFDMTLDEAFSESRYNLNHTIDMAAQSWMIAENFRNGDPMSITTGEYRQEFAYQPRGYAKYADIVRLFGWDALQQFFYNLNVAYEEGTTYSYHVSYVPWDEMSLRLSIAVGYDLTPLLHFWGIHPEDADTLAASIAENNLPASVEIYDQLVAYKAIPLADNAAFQAFGLADFNEDDITSFVNPFDHNPLSYYEGFLSTWWNVYDESHALTAQEQVQAIIDLYFPDGRPNE